MKYDAMGLLRQAADGLRRRDLGMAYAVLELANNLRLVMRDEATVAEFRECYVGFDREPIDIDAVLPVPEPEAPDAE